MCREKMACAEALSSWFEDAISWVWAGGSGAMCWVSAGTRSGAGGAGEEEAG